MAAQQHCRHYRALYGACSLHILLQRIPGYYSESEYHRMLVDREFDLNTLRVDGEIFAELERKSCGLKNIRILVDGASMLS